MTRTRLAEWIGRTLIGGLWLLAIYLVLYYAVLFYFGPDRLYEYLGEAVYNALFPMGGLSLLLHLGLLTVVWGGPVIVFGALVAGMSVLVAPRWRRLSRFRTAVIVGVLLTAALTLVPLDGWPDPLLSLICCVEDTEYSPTYDAFGFWLVGKGMTMEEVLATAGEPLERYPIVDQPDREGWRWTRSPGSHSYWVRAVIFEHGKVIEKHSAFYVD